MDELKIWVVLLLCNVFLWIFSSLIYFYYLGYQQGADDGYSNGWQEMRMTCDSVIDGYIDEISVCEDAWNVCQNATMNCLESYSAKLSECKTEINMCNFKIPEFLDIATDVVNYKPYHYPDWCCVQMSDMLAHKLNNRGWDAETIIGWYNGGRHTWVELTIQIEATTGQIIDPSVYREFYKED